MTCVCLEHALATTHKVRSHLMHHGTRWQHLTTRIAHLSFFICKGGPAEVTTIVWLVLGSWSDSHLQVSAHVERVANWHSTALTCTTKCLESLVLLTEACVIQRRENIALSIANLIACHSSSACNRRLQSRSRHGCTLAASLIRWYRCMTPDRCCIHLLTATSLNSERWSLTTDFSCILLCRIKGIGRRALCRYIGIHKHASINLLRRDRQSHLLISL